MLQNPGGTANPPGETPQRPYAFWGDLQFVGLLGCFMHDDFDDPVQEDVPHII